MRPLSFFIFIPLLIAIFFTHTPPLRAEEGMYPLSELSKVELHTRGLEIDAKELYNPDGTSIVDSIINLGGCTASFVSPDGLILTNYHCALRAVQSVTSTENDYMLNGFFAETRETEREAKGYNVRLIESYKDVSAEVLQSLSAKMTHKQRTEAIEKKINQMVSAFEKKNPGKRAEVAEMFQGKTYVMFFYAFIKDVRLVYAPPRSIGEYGGEEDNWAWPRHTGDFTFLRAYVAPDGSSADYSPANVPFHPKKFLKVAPKGVNVEDFIFILGYPGRTFRHKTSHYLAFDEEIAKPNTIELNTWMINLMEEMSKADRNTLIKLAPDLKGLWNTMKRSKGQLKGLKNLQIVEQRRKEEEKLQAWINADPARQKKYGAVLADTGTVYAEKRKLADLHFILNSLSRRPVLLSAAITAYEASVERAKKDEDREDYYVERNFKDNVRDLLQDLKNFHEPLDKLVVKELLTRASRLTGPSVIPPAADIVRDKDPETALNDYVAAAFAATQLRDPQFLESLFAKSTPELDQMTDPFIVLARALYPLIRTKREFEKSEKGRLDNLSALFTDVKQAFLGQEFIPDANGTLRFTYGRVRGYSPADAVEMQPFTTLTGILEKNRGADPFDAPAKVLELARNKDIGAFAHPALNDVPVAMIYNTDTTGGNSGSPVLNARGELVGLNFDRCAEATINDFEWDESYSRSIGVDIRYILWFMEKFSNAGRLLKEMGVR